MADKIIIDGINVAGCEYIYYAIDDKNKQIPRCTIGCKFHNFACENENCYYKQLKHLEQENVRLKENLEDFQNRYSKQYQVNENKGYLKAEQALDEIYNYIKNHKCVNTLVYGIDKVTQDKILQIISSVKGK